MAYEHTRLAHERLVGKASIGPHLDQGAGERFLTGRLHREGRAVGEWCMEFVGLDGGVPLRPAGDVSEERPHALGTRRGLDAVFMPPHGRLGDVLTRALSRER